MSKSNRRRWAAWATALLVVSAPTYVPTLADTASATPGSPAFTHYAVIDAIDMPVGSSGYAYDIAVRDDSIWVNDGAEGAYALNPYTNTWVNQNGISGYANSYLYYGMALSDDSVYATVYMPSWISSWSRSATSGAPDDTFDLYSIPWASANYALAADATGHVYAPVAMNNQHSPDIVVKVNPSLTALDDSVSVPGSGYASSIALRDDTLYVPVESNSGTDDSVAIIRTSDMTVLRNVPAADSVYAVTVTSNGRIVSGGDDDGNVVVASSSGAVLATIQTPDSAVDRLAITADDTVIGGYDYINIINGASMTLDDSLQVPSNDYQVQYAGTIGIWDGDLDRGIAYVPTYYGRILVVAPVSASLSGSSGAVTMSVNGPPDALIDDSTVTRISVGGSPVSFTALGNGQYSFTMPGGSSTADVAVDLLGGNTIGIFTASGHTVTFAANGGTGSMAPQTSATSAALTLNAFSRSGYSFSGWNTQPGGTGTPYADGATYAFTADDTMYAQWTAPAPTPPGAPRDVAAVPGNGSAIVSWSPPVTSGSYPVSQYQVVATPGGASCMTSALTCNVRGLANGTSYTFTVKALSGAGWGPPSGASAPVTPSAAPVPAPEPVPVPPLPPGDSQLVVNGVPQQVAVDPNAQDNGLRIEGDDFSMVLQGLGDGGTPLNLAADGALILNSDRQVQTSGTGFLPTSEVDLYLDPPTLLTSQQGRSLRADGGLYVGTVTTSGSGSFSGRATLPADVAVGDHVLQAVGRSASGATRALSLGVRVLAPASITLIKGQRVHAGQHDRITASGTSTGIEAGARLTPYIKYSGRSRFEQGTATITVQADGTFTWTRKIKKSKDLRAYVAFGPTQSNRVTWVSIG